MQWLIQGLELFGVMLLLVIVCGLYVAITRPPPGVLKAGDTNDKAR